MGVNLMLLELLELLCCNVKSLFPKHFLTNSIPKQQSKLKSLKSDVLTMLRP